MKRSEARSRERFGVCFFFFAFFAKRKRRVDETRRRRVAVNTKLILTYS